MKLIPRYLIVGVTAVVFSLAAQAQDDPSQCEKPSVPTNIPSDGASATQEEMSSSQASMQEYADQATEYMNCLKNVAANWGEDVGEEAQEELVAMHNAMVTELEEAAERFNAAVRAFKEAE